MNSATSRQAFFKSSSETGSSLILAKPRSYSMDQPFGPTAKTSSIGKSRLSILTPKARRSTSPTPSLRNKSHVKEIARWLPFERGDQFPRTEIGKGYQ